MEIGKVLPHTIYRMAKEIYLNKPEAECIYIPCARWPTIDIIQKLEDDLRIPVITATQSMIWWALRLLRIGDSIKGYGRILEMR